MTTSKLATLGSSPLTRGKLSRFSTYLLECRLIPAHAGKTTMWILFVSELTAHPRSRGENLSTRQRVHCVTGSSPLTRGKRGNSNVQSIDDRLIPAHAGKTRAPTTTRAR